MSQYEKQSKIQIQVCDPIEKDGFKKFTVYCIKGEDNNGIFEVYRRYSDFFKLRQAMLIKWPGVYIAEIPPKKTFGNQNKEFIDKRKSSLNKFAQSISLQINIYYSDEFQLFLRSQNPSFEKELETISKLDYKLLIQKIRQAYPQLQDKEINVQIELKISQFTQFVKKIKSQLIQFKEMAKNINKAKQQFQENFHRFQIQMMPKYEKTCIAEYLKDDQYLQQNEIEKNLPVTKFNLENNAEQMNQFQNSVHSEIVIENQNNKQTGYQNLENTLNEEILSIDAMNDALDSKLYYQQLQKKNEIKQKELQLEQQKILAGKTTLKTLFNKSNIQQVIKDIQLQIQSLQQDQENIIAICNFITIILGYIEIDKFKNDKLKKYFQMLNLMSQQEYQYQVKITDFWSQVQENQNLYQIYSNQLQLQN